MKHERFFIQSFSPLFLSSPENIWCYNAFPLITIGIIPPRLENFKVFSRKLDKKINLLKIRKTPKSSVSSTALRKLDISTAFP